MATTCTAEIIFGKADQNNSGIQFNHRLNVYEGFKAMLVFEKKPSADNGGALIDRWLCHTDRFVEDAMVMIAGYGAGNQEILDLIKTIKQQQGEQEVLNLYEVNDEVMESLYALSRQTFKLKVHRTRNSRSAERSKITACIFRGSSLWRQVGRLQGYDIDIEVCQSVFQSEYSAWSDRIDTWGELK